MKKSFYLIITLLFFTSLPTLAQNAYAKFSQTPNKRISSTHIETTSFYVEYLSRKKATIYIELIKDGKSYAYANKTVRSKEKAITKLNIVQKSGVSITPGSGYSLKLKLFEGDSNNLRNLLSETVVEDVSLTRLLYSKL